MAASSVIDSYVAELSRRLPAPIAEELSDGVQEAYLHFQSAGLDDEQSARAALQEFGAADTVVASFVDASPARRTSRRLLLTGPLAGACWAAVLLDGRAWTWPVPPLARAVFGAVLAAVISTLLIAAIGQPEYRPAQRAALAGCLGLLTLDAAMLVTAAAAANLPPALLALAACASGTRILLVLHSLPRMLESTGPAAPPRA